jgi:hypothetical protein
VNENTDHIFVPCPALRKVFIHEETQLEIFADEERGTLELREDGWIRVILGDHRRRGHKSSLPD